MKKIATFLFLCITFLSFSQQKELSIDDTVLGYYKGLYPKNLTNLQWVKNSTEYVFIQENKLIFTDAKSNKVTHSIELSILKKAYPELTKFPSLAHITNSILTFKNNNKFERFNYKTNKKLPTVLYDKEGKNIDFNATSNSVAYTIDNNLFIGNSTDSKKAITKIDDANIVSGQAIHRSEFGIRKGTFWSPSGKHLAFYQKDETNVTNYPLVDITTYPASLNNNKYPMAGQASEQAKIGVYCLSDKKLVYLDIDTSDEHYLTNLTWTPDENYVIVAEVNRAQNHVWVNRYSINTGKKVNTIFEETNNKWVEPEYQPVFLPNSTTDFLWMSERDGFMNLYHYTINGKLVKQLTNFKWVVTSILGFDATGNHVIIQGTGTDPRENHTFKVNLTSGKSLLLTKNIGTHKTMLSGFGNFLIDNYSNVNTPRKINIIDIKKGAETTIYTAENPLKDYAVGTTELLTLQAEDGTNLFAKLIKPTNFDPSKKYPVLVYVYGGPHAQLVTNSWLAGSSLWMPAFATLENYLVFTLDNRGSAHRGFEFESAIHRNLGDVEIQDQLTGIEYLKSLSYVDTERIAVNGWSYGGFMTTSLMLRNPGLFTTAVAGGPVTDWKFYEVMYGERYMDSPEENPEGYKKARVHNYIKNLDGKMLIIHGSVDPVVVPQHSMTLLQEAVTNKVQIDFFTYPMHPHNVRGVDRVHLVKKMLEYIVTNNKAKKSKKVKSTI